MAKKKQKAAGEAAQASPPAQPPQPPPSTVHVATLASGGSGAVEFGAELDEPAAVEARKRGEDVVVRGQDLKNNRDLARKIEAQVGPVSKPQVPHTQTAGPMALPHFHQASSVPGWALLLRDAQPQSEEEAMKFFTPDLIERFGSDDDRIALPAHEEMEQRSIAYHKHLETIATKLP